MSRGMPYRVRLHPPPAGASDYAVRAPTGAPMAAPGIGTGAWVGFQDAESLFETTTRDVRAVGGDVFQKGLRRAREAEAEGKHPEYLQHTAEALGYFVAKGLMQRWQEAAAAWQAAASGPPQDPDCTDEVREELETLMHNGCRTSSTRKLVP